MTWILIFLTVFWILYLIHEAVMTSLARKKLPHVIHVNGTRGKSTTCRLIEAGLRAGNMRIFCKTTGTDPQTIDTNGLVTPVVRHGKANIKEQIRILWKASRQQTDVLIIECMALQPELQHISQHRILHADIGVITNVRRDHTDVMGNTLSEICTALSNTIPEKGILFTGETDSELLSQLETSANKLGSLFFSVQPDGTEPPFDFPDNIALALSVCQYLGIPREIALNGMRHYRRDPYSLGIYHLKNALFIDGLSINDMQSIELVWEQLKKQYILEDKQLILLVNNRADRGARTQDMLQICLKMAPSQIWLMGAAKNYMKFHLAHKLPLCRLQTYSRASELNFSSLPHDCVILAIGNIAGQGRDLIARVRKEDLQNV